MYLSLTVTLIVVAMTAGVFGFANWRARQPPEPLKVRMINYHVVQMACIVVLLLMISHLLTLYFGHPVTGQQSGGQF
jgi:hypothetical protein